MRIKIQTGKPLGPAPGEPVILFAVGPVTFAIAAVAVEEIRNLEGLAPFAPPAHARFRKVRFTMERERKTYFVVDANTHFCMLPTRATRLLLLRDIAVAVTVDSIDRMAEISAVQPLPRAFSGEEQNWYRGLAVLQDQVIPVVNPGSFLTRTELVELRAAPTSSTPESKSAQGAVAG